MTNATGCAAAPTTDPCSRCDVLLGLEGVHVEAVERGEALMTVTVSTPRQPGGCPDCGVVAPSRGRRARVLNDVPHGGIRVRLAWRQRMWRCPDPGCERGTFAEQVPSLVAVRGLARRLGVGWWTLWRAARPELERLAADPTRFGGVTSLGVDEHIWQVMVRRTAVTGQGR